MFLKHYLGLSDADLIDRIRTDWVLQMFCFLKPEPVLQIKDSDVVGRWRATIGKHLNLREDQKLLAQSWKDVVEHPHMGMSDATCYESYIKYPTSVKLLWDALEDLMAQILRTCKATKQKQPRSKFLEIEKRVLAYSRKRRKTKKETRAIIRSLLYLLQKLVDQWQSLQFDEQALIYHVSKFPTIRIILSQQKQLFEDSSAEIKDRIVSLYKPYIRPIVRGKENKPVEFGAKVHMHQVGGLDFIEHLSFNAFHEGNRMEDSVRFHQHLFGKITVFGGDQIYATNKNRRYCTEHGIATCFKRKGRAGKEEAEKAALRSVVGKERATRLEGSFGNQKNHYLLGKVKARMKETEIAWIFFGIHTANAAKVVKMREAKMREIVNVAA